MTTAIKRRRGTTTQHSSFTGLEGELTVDTTKDTVVVHDGSTAGGFPLAKESGSNITAASLSVTGAFSANGGATLGDASGDALTINSSAVSIPNGLNFDSNTLVIDATNNRVGIGTASPSRPLEVSATAGLIRITSTSGSSQLELNAFAGNLNYISYNLGGSGGLSFYDAASTSERMRIDTSGNVGIGTSNPAAVGSRVVVVPSNTTGSSAYSAIGISNFADTDLQFYVTGSAATDKRAVISSTTGTSIAFGTANTERMRIDSSGNVGIGTSSPTAYGSYRTLEVKGTGGGLVQVGSNATPAVFFQDGTNAGINNFASGSLISYTNNTERMRIDSSGNVGIGNTVASTINTENNSGNLVVGAGNTTEGITVYSGNTSIGALCFADGTTTTSTYAGYLQYSHASDAMAFATNATERMRIDSSGNVGIGTTTITNALSFPIGTNKYIGQAAATAHAASNVGSMGLVIGDGGGDSGVFVHNTHNGSFSSQDIRFVTAQGGISLATERMRITSAGRVGIGTSSPIDALQVAGAVVSTSNTVLDASSSAAVFDYHSPSDGTRIIACDPSGSNIQFLTNPASGSLAERMRITSGGNVAIGSTGLVGNERLRVVQVDNSNTGRFEATNANQSNDVVQVVVSRNTTNNSYYAYTYYNSGAGVNRFQVADSGNVTNTNGSYGTISDVKNKENIVDATPKLDKVNQLKVRNFNFKGDDLKQIGFVAQEFEQVFPSMIEEHKDTDAEGNDLGTTTKSIKTSVLVPILVKAIQEQQAMIEELKQEVAALKAK